MSLTPLIIGAALILAIICVSLYGAATLPPGSKVPVHFGPGGYNQWLPKNIGLTLWPALGTVLFVIIVVTVHGRQAHGGLGPVVGLSIALGVILVTQVGALAVARGQSRRG